MIVYERKPPALGERPPNMESNITALLMGLASDFHQIWCAISRMSDSFLSDLTSSLLKLFGYFGGPFRVFCHDNQFDFVTTTQYVKGFTQLK